MTRSSESVQPSQPANHPQSTVRIKDYGDEVHLWVEQRVPWKVALEVLKEITAPGARREVTIYPRRVRQPSSPIGRRAAVRANVKPAA